MRLTPPTNVTFGLSIVLVIIGLVLSIQSGFSTAGLLALAAWLVLFAGNLYEKI